MKFVKIEFTEEGFFCRRPARKEQFIPWSQMTEVGYSEGMKWIVFRTDGHGKVRVSVYRDGLDTLMDLLQREAPGLPGTSLSVLREKIANPL